VLGVVLVVELVGAGLAAAIALATGERPPSTTSLLIAVVAGGCGVLGIISLYRGLAVGRMGVVAPVTALVGAGIPVTVGIVTEGLPPATVGLGIGLGLIAVLLVSQAPPEADGRRSGIELALLAGIGIGAFNVLIAGLPDGELFWPLTALRLAAVPMVVAVIVIGRQAWRLPRRSVGAASIVGIFDMGGNAFYMLAAQTGALAVAAVLSSLYPVVTVVLAVLLLHERLTRTHAVGVAVAGLAVALIASG
jgi:drug/metabolite transporter (DMT)-like permease